MSENGSHQHNSNSNHQSNDVSFKFTPQKLDAPQRRESGDNHKMISIVFLSLLVDLLAFTMILPLLPSLLDYYAQHDKVTISSLLLRQWTLLVITQNISNGDGG